jgi:hypothetical protein
VTASYSSQLLQVQSQAQPDAGEKQQAAWLQDWQQHQAQLSQTAVWQVMMRVRVWLWPRGAWARCFLHVQLVTLTSHLSSHN